MIVMLRYKVQVIDQPHGSSHPRVRKRTSDPDGIRPISKLEQARPRLPEPIYNFAERLGIMPGLMRLPVGEIGRGKFSMSSDKILNARHPKRFQVQQVPHMFLDRPLVSGLPDQQFALAIAQHLLQPRGSTLQSHAHARI